MAASIEMPRSRCLELALEGQRLCNAGDTKAGISYLESALAEGTDNLQTLSAIYSQLGNGYYYLRNYGKALEYHRHDLTLARALNDNLGDGKASGNLGNTLKVLGRFDEAIVCCQRHLDITRKVGDKAAEARALYNMANVYHAKGKQTGRLSTTPDLSPLGDNSKNVHETLLKAIHYYEANLELVETLKDKAAQGRACGNLGNTHYLLGNFEKAVEYHNQRLGLAKEFGDKVAMRRAYSNLGNAHIFMGELEKALQFYRLALKVAVELSEKATEAQACFSIGHTCSLIGYHDQAIDFHCRHLRIARDLSDRVGESRACSSLVSAFTTIGDDRKALYFAALTYKLANEMGDHNGESVAFQQMSELRTQLGSDAGPDASADPSPTVSLNDSVQQILSYSTQTDVGLTRRRANMDNGSNPLVSKKYSAPPSASSVDVHNIRPTLDKSHALAEALDEESFFDMISRMQSKRIDDQRFDPKSFDYNKENNGPRMADTLRPDGKSRRLSSFGIGRLNVDLRLNQKRSDRRMERKKRRASLFGVFLPKITSNPTVPTAQIPDLPEFRRASLAVVQQPSPSAACAIPTPEQTPEEFMEMIAGIQGRRMDDQRARLECLPGLQHSEALFDQLTKGPSVDGIQMQGRASSMDARKSSVDAATDRNLDDDFIDMLIRCQSTRIEDQRSELPSKKPAPTVPEEDIFQLVLKMQSGRFEEQRANLETPDNQKNGSALLESVPSASGSAVKETKSRKR